MWSSAWPMSRQRPVSGMAGSGSLHTAPAASHRVAAGAGAVCLPVRQLRPDAVDPADRQGTCRRLSDLMVGFISAIPYIGATIAMLCDRREFGSHRRAFHACGGAELHRCGGLRCERVHLIAGAGAWWR